MSDTDSEYEPSQEVESEEEDVGLHPVMYYSPQQCIRFLHDRQTTERISKLVGCTEQELRSFSGTQTQRDVDITHDGDYWADWVTCHISKPTEPRIQTREKPDLLGEKEWTNWRFKTRNGQVRILEHVVACRAQYGDLQIPDKLGEGAGVSHLCDTDRCIRKEHMDSLLLHKKNMDRQRCLGMTLIVYEDTIVQEEPCIHAQDNDLCCRRVRVIILNDWAVKCIKKF